MQMKDTPGYPIPKRGIYYGSRLISAQRGTVFKNQEYGKIKKVVSIWICQSISPEAGALAFAVCCTTVSSAGVTAAAETGGKSGLGGTLSVAAKDMLKEIKASLAKMPDPGARKLLPGLSVKADGTKTETFT